MYKRYSFIVVAILVFFAGCKKSNDYPIEPAITFKSLTTVKDLQGYDDYAVLEIAFTDGDGDIGLNPGDTFPPYTGEYVNNVIALFYHDTSGVWTPLSQFDDKGRVPVVTPEGNTKSIRGEIKKQPVFLPNNRTNLPVRFEVFIYDRALHRSNIVTTSTIIINTQ